MVNLRYKKGKLSLKKDIEYDDWFSTPFQDTVYTLVLTIISSLIFFVFLGFFINTLILFFITGILPVPIVFLIGKRVFPLIVMGAMAFVASSAFKGCLKRYWERVY